MADWNGYPMPEGAHPERPWWRRAPGYEGGEMWVRTDGRKRINDVVTADDLAWVDREHPLPAPHPRVGQVWRFADGYESMVLAKAGPTSLLWSGRPLAASAEWPPARAVLVAGPGSPWAPDVSNPPPKLE